MRLKSIYGAPSYPSSISKRYIYLGPLYIFLKRWKYINKNRTSGWAKGTKTCITFYLFSSRENQKKLRGLESSRRFEGTIATKWRAKVALATNNNGEWPKTEKKKKRPSVSLCVCFVRKTERKQNKRKEKQIRHGAAWTCCVSPCNNETPSQREGIEQRHSSSSATVNFIITGPLITSNK